jgi:hypothetical protein
MAAVVLAREKRFGNFVNTITVIPFSKLIGANQLKHNLNLSAKPNGKRRNAFGFGAMRLLQWITVRVVDCR